MKETKSFVIIKTLLFLDHFKAHNKIEMKVELFLIYSLPPHMLSLPHYQHPHHSGTFVTTEEPTMTHHNHSKFMVNLRAFTFYGFRQMYDM